MSDNPNPRLGCILVTVGTAILWLAIGLLVWLVASGARAQTVCCGPSGQMWPCTDATCKGPIGLTCTGTGVSQKPASACAATTPTPAPTATATPTPTAPPMAVTPVQVPFAMPTANFLYAPSCVVLDPSTTSTPYQCLPTVGDEIRLYTSTDRVTWADKGVVLPALCGTWEDTGLEHSGSATCSGVSNMTVAWSRTAKRWIGAYIAGWLPNLAPAGGIGLAWAPTLAGPWTRYSGNPIIAEMGGFAGNPVLLRLTQSADTSPLLAHAMLWLYFTGADASLYRVPIDDTSGVVVGTVQSLPALQGYVPIATDWLGCWLERGIGWTDVAGFGSVEVWHGGDCATTPGTLLGTIVASQLTHATATVQTMAIGSKRYLLPPRARGLHVTPSRMAASASVGTAPAGIVDIGVLERSGDGMILGGPTLIVAAWDSWAATTPPVAVRFGAPLSMQMPLAVPWASIITAASPASAPLPTWIADVNEQFGSVVVTAACGALPCTITATRSGVGGFAATSIDSGPAWGTVALGPIYPLYVQIANRGVPMPSTVTVTNALTVMSYQIDPYGQWQIVPFRRQPAAP